MNPLLEEIELNEKVDALLKLEEVEYVLKNPQVKEERLKTIDKTRVEVENSALSYTAKSKMEQKIYASKFVLGLRQGNDYAQLLASGGLGFLLGFIVNDQVRNYLNKIAKDFVSSLQYSKS